ACRDRRLDPGLAIGEGDHAHRGVAVVGEDIAPGQRRIGRAAVHATAGDGAVAGRVAGRDQRLEIAAAAAGGVVGLVAFVAAPAEVQAAAGTGLDEVDLLVGVLADVGDPQVTQQGV